MLLIAPKPVSVVYMAQYRKMLNKPSRKSVKSINMLNALKGAGFDWLAGEDMYMVVEAEWKKTGKKKEDPDGFLYISNKRLIMEQDEKKGGFMGFGGKKESGLLWEAPIGSITDVDFEKKGMLGRIDLLHIKMGSGAPFGDVTIELHEGGVSAKWFASKLNQAVSGELEKERGMESHDQAIVEAIADAPTMCPVCGANFDQELPVAQHNLNVHIVAVLYASVLHKIFS